MTQLHSFLHLLFIGIIALFPVVNPIGSALIINPYLARLSDAEKKNAITKITLYAFLICIISLFTGHWILDLFGISIPVIQIAGGILICKMGWESLSSDKQQNNKDRITSEEEINNVDIFDKLFYPLTFPITTGAGTMSVLFTLSAHTADTNWENYLVKIFAIILAIIIMCILVFFFYSNTKKIMSKLGTNGENIANKIFAFLIFCVGLDIAIAGIKTIW